MMQEMNGWKDLKPLRDCCLQILPTIFDESMSYFELICKIIYKQNEIIDFMNFINNKIINVIKNEIHDTIRDEFNNIISTQLYDEKNEILKLTLKMEDTK